MTFRILDDRGRKLAEGKDLGALKERLKPKLREELSSAADDLERTGLRAWEFGEVPRVYEQHQRGVALKAYPALVDEGQTVGLKLLDTPREQAEAMRLGVRRLLLLTIPSPAKVMLASLDNKQKLALGTNPYGPVPLLFEDCVACAADYLMDQAGGPVWDEAGFAALREKVRADLAETACNALGIVADTLAAAHELERRLKGTVTLGLLPSLTDVRTQLGRLLPKGFISATGCEQLRQLPRYLRAIAYRLDKMADDPYRDQANMAKVGQLEREYEDALARVPKGREPDAQLRQARWLIEEYRVSLFAQQIGTATTVSEKRIRKLLA
jgi:ATP-dependent helicase HrpA